MMSVSFREMCKCRWREFRREPSAFFWVIFMPLIWMVILGLAFSKPRADVYGVAIVAADPAKYSHDLELALKQNPSLKVKATTMFEANRMLRRGDVVITATLSDNDVLYYLDPTNPNAIRARSVVNEQLQVLFGRHDPLPSSTVAMTLRGARYIDFLVPGLLAMSIMTSSLFGVGMTLVSNRKENLLKRYKTTPMRPYEFLGSHIVGRLIVFFYEFMTILTAGWLFFRFQVEGNFLSFALVALLGTATFTGIALLCASRTSSIPAMGGMINLISLPMVLLSGIFYSTTGLPGWLQNFVKILPLSNLVDALRMVALENTNISHLTPQLSCLAIYLVVSVVAAKLSFRWY